MLVVGAYGCGCCRASPSPSGFDKGRWVRWRVGAVVLMSDHLALPIAEVPAGLLQARLEVPAFVERLEDVREVLLVQVVEARDDGVQFMDHVLLHVVVERTALDTDGIGPFAEACVGTREATSELNDPLPSRVRRDWARNRKRIENEVVEAEFDEPARVPVERKAGEHAE